MTENPASLDKMVYLVDLVPRVLLETQAKTETQALPVFLELQERRVQQATQDQQDPPENLAQVVRTENLVPREQMVSLELMENQDLTDHREQRETLVLDFLEKTVTPANLERTGKKEKLVCQDPLD